MTPELEAVARRAVACPRWRWMPGMSSVAYRQPPLEPVVHRIGDLKLTPYPGSLPNLTDFATLGCLLALVREAWGDPGFYAAQGSTKIKDTNTFGWDTFGYLHGKSYKGMLYRSEAEALVAALEAAP